MAYRHSRKHLAARRRRRTASTRPAGPGRGVRITSTARPDLAGTWTYKVYQSEGDWVWTAYQNGSEAKYGGGRSKSGAVRGARGYIAYIKKIAAGRHEHASRETRAADLRRRRHHTGTTCALCGGRHRWQKCPHKRKHASRSKVPSGAKKTRWGSNYRNRRTGLFV